MFFVFLQFLQVARALVALARFLACCTAFAALEASP